MKNGLLIVNLGTPEAPTTQAVKAYLKVFLSDQNVIKMPSFFWQPILKHFILPTRSWRSATFYQHVWDKDGSPLMKYTKIQSRQIQQLLPDWQVSFAMTYGQPNIKKELTSLKESGCTNIVVIPLYPQYSTTTTKSIIDQVKQSNIPVHIIESFYNDERYLKLLASTIKKQWDPNKYDQLLVSYHGIPASYVRHGDPYLKQCNATTQGIMEHISSLNKENTTQVFQSKFGPAPWLKPYLRQTLQQLPVLGKRKVLIVSPSFVADCLETLEEINVQSYQTFKSAGGDLFDVVNPLNDNLEFSQFLADLALTQTSSGRI
jgi:ferrochelatase